MNLPTQWHLIPIAPGAKHPGSIVGSGWQHKASADPQQIEAWQQAHTDCNWGLLLGPKSGVIDLEYDDDEGREIIEAAVSACGVQTVTYKSAKSVHRLFQFDQRFEGLKAKESYRGTEWRFGDDKAQSVIPPSVHETGIFYEWLPGCSPDEIEVAALPDELWKLYERLRDEAKPVPTVSVSARSFDGDGLIDLARNHVEQNHEWQSLLQEHGWTLNRALSDNSSEWTRPGKKTGVSAKLNFDGSGTLRVFSSNAAPLEAESSYDKFAFICRMIHNDDAVTAAKAILPSEVLQARQDEWFEQQEANLPEVDLSGITAKLDGLKAETLEAAGITSGVITLEQLQQLAAQEKDSDNNAHLTEIHLPQEVFDDAPGFIGDYFKFIGDISNGVMPESRLAAGIAMMSVVTGRDFNMQYKQFRTHSNLYLLILSGSGEGKNLGRNINREVIKAIESERLPLAHGLMGAEDFTSDTAFLNSLNEFECRLFQIDEFSKFLGGVNSRNASSNLAGVAKTMMTVFTESDNDEWASRAYADLSKQILIDRPHAVIYSTTTADDFWQKLRAEQVKDGLLGRMLLFEDLDPPSREFCQADIKLDEDGYVVSNGSDAIQPPDSITDPLKYWLDSRDPAKRTELRISHKAFRRMEREFHEMKHRPSADDSTGSALWNRASEKVSKLAMIAAMSRLSLSVELSDVEWAITIVNAIIERTSKRADTEVASGFLHENVNFVLKQFEKRPAMSRRDLVKKVHRRLRGNELQDIINNLCTAGELQRAVVQRKTRPGEWFGTSYRSILEATQTHSSTH